MSTKKKRASKQMSYAPSVPWGEYLCSILGRYPYRLPTVPEKGPHPQLKGESIPGGMHTFPRGNSAKLRGGD